MGSNLCETLYNWFFYSSALDFGDKTLAQQLVQKIAAQIEFVPDHCFIIHVFPPYSYIKCANFNPVLRHSNLHTFQCANGNSYAWLQSGSLVFYSGFLRWFACKNFAVFVLQPRQMGIFQTAVGTMQHDVAQWQPKAQHGCCANKVVTTSWESHPLVVLTRPPPLLLTVAGRKYHYPSVQVIAHLLPHKFRELLFIARCALAAYVKFFLNLIFEMYSLG